VAQVAQPVVSLWAPSAHVDATLDGKQTGFREWSSLLAQRADPCKWSAFSVSLRVRRFVIAKNTPDAEKAAGENNHFAFEERATDTNVL
jgi:hypothetical protein